MSSSPSVSPWIWLGLSLAIATASVIVGERFPISDWPMYAAPGSVRGVVVVVDGQGDGVDVEALSGRSASRLQKRLSRPGTGTMDDRVVDVGCDLRRQAATRGTSLPEGASLWWLDLARSDDDGTVTVRPLRLGPIPPTCEAP